jgi:hypothetical protein
MPSLSGLVDAAAPAIPIAAIAAAVVAVARGRRRPLARSWRHVRRRSLAIQRFPCSIVPSWEELMRLRWFENTGRRCMQLALMTATNVSWPYGRLLDATVYNESPASVISAVGDLGLRRAVYAER